MNFPPFALPQVTMFWASHVPRPKPGPDCQAGSSNANFKLQAFKAVLLVGATMCSLSTQTCLHDVFQTPRIYKEKYSD